jgi:hypothetical protein
MGDELSLIAICHANLSRKWSLQRMFDALFRDATLAAMLLEGA